MEAANTFPFEIKDVEPKLNAELTDNFTGAPSGFVQVGRSRYLFPARYRASAAAIYNTPLRDSDVLVMSCPRSGTTLTQELVWMIANDLDYETSKNVSLRQRYHFLEACFMLHPYTRIKEKTPAACGSSEHNATPAPAPCPLSRLAAAPAPRFLKSHLPLSLVPARGGARAVYVARDPRDLAVSLYHHSATCNVHGYVGDFKLFWSYFVRGLVYSAPIFAHLKEAWEMRNQPNMLFLFYEDLMKDMPSVIGRVSRFLDKSLSAAQTARLCQHLSIDNFRNSRSLNYEEATEYFVGDDKPHIRKGGSGGWREYFDEAMSAEADAWIADNLRDTDLRFPHVTLC